MTASVTGQVISGTVDAGGEIQPGTLTLLIAVENRVDGVVFGTDTIPMIDDGAAWLAPIPRRASVRIDQLQHWRVLDHRGDYVD